MSDARLVVHSPARRPPIRVRTASVVTLDLPVRFPTEPVDRHLAADGMRHMRLVLHLDGRVDVERMRHAVQQMLDALPILRSRLTDRKWQPCWEAGANVSADDILQLRPADPGRGAAAHDNTVPAQALQVIVTQGLTDDVTVLFDHPLGDFRAMLRCVQLLADTYSALERDHGYVLPPLPLADRSFRSLARRLPRPERLQILKAGVKVLNEFRRCGRWRLRHADSIDPTASGFVVRHEFCADEAASLEAYALRRRVTTYHALLAAYFLALTEVLPDSDDVLAIGAPVDLRRRFGSESPFSIGNICGIEPIILQRSSLATWDAAIEAVRQQMFVTRKSTLGTTGSPLFLECLPVPTRWLQGVMPYAVMQRRQRRRRVATTLRRELHAVTATLGNRIDSERTRFGSLTIRGADNEFRPTETFGFRALQALAFDDRLTVSIGWGRSEEMEAVRDALLRVLQPALATLVVAKPHAQ